MLLGGELSKVDGKKRREQRYVIGAGIMYVWMQYSTAECRADEDDFSLEFLNNSRGKPRAHATLNAERLNNAKSQTEHLRIGIRETW